MEQHYLEYSGSSEGESALSKAAQSYRHSTQDTGPGHGSGRQEEAEELLLSEFLLSLQSSAGYHADLMQASYTTAATGPAPPRGLGRRTTAAGKAPAVRRTVVHRRKRRDDLAGPCNHCGALTSPQWRKGPKGKPVLCNACGIRFLRNRTLTKVMPKKRRHAGSGGKRRTPAAALAAAAEGEDDDLLDDPMTAADDDTDETYSAVAAVVAAQAYSASMQPGLQQQPLFLQSRFAAVAGTALPCPEDEVSAREAAPSAREAAGAGSDEDCAAAPAVMCAGKQCAPAVPSVSRDSLFSTRSNSNSSRNLLVQLGDCPSLTLALALHQQQQQRRQQEEQDAEDELHQHSSKYRLPNFPELQLFPPSSPPADCAGTGFTLSPKRTHAQAQAAAAAGVAGVSSPVCSADSFLQLQHQHSSSGSPPLSPLFLGAASTAVAGVASASASPAAAKVPQPGDILQLVQQLGHALGGVGPAIEFLKLCNGNAAALAAAVAAVATPAAGAGL